MLYTEVDRLSTAWAVLDEQNRDKVFKLAEHDEKVLKAVHEVSRIPMKNSTHYAAIGMS